MKQRKNRKVLLASALLLLTPGLAGCGGGALFDLDGDWGFVPIPPDEPAPSAQPATIGDVEQPGVGANTDRVVWSQELDDEEVTGALKFRLVQYATETDLGPPVKVSSDRLSNQGGASLIITVPEDPDEDLTVSLDIKNAGLGVDNVVLEPSESAPVFEATLPNGKIVQVSLDGENQNSGRLGEYLDWTAYGVWSVSSADGKLRNDAHFVTGVETPDSDVPTTGTATFDGFVQGSVIKPDGSNVKTAALQGDATITADFASGTISGSAPDITAVALGNPGAPQQWNGLVFEGTFTSGVNGFSGTTGVSNAPNTEYALDATAEGFFAGMFYGPAANELGAAWNLSDGAGAASGILVGKQ